MTRSKPNWPAAEALIDLARARGRGVAQHAKELDVEVVAALRVVAVLARPRGGRWSSSGARARAAVVEVVPEGRDAGVGGPGDADVDRVERGDDGDVWAALPSSVGGRAGGSAESHAGPASGVRIEPVSSAPAQPMSDWL